VQSWDCGLREILNPEKGLMNFYCVQLPLALSFVLEAKLVRQKNI
jgi:hypothetical protein